jgi:hypothetical protein
MAKKLKKNAKSENVVVENVVTPAVDAAPANLFEAFIDLSDPELSQVIERLEAERNSCLAHREDPTEIEIEKCYAQREWRLRAERWRAHCAYLDADAESLREDQYPIADLDNWEFVSICNGARTPRVQRA